MDETASFGYWVRRRRKALDLTQRALAEALPASIATIKKIESDERRPSPEMAQRLAECLLVPEEERSLFLAVARGKRAAFNLRLDGEPILWERVNDRIPTPPTPFLGRENELAAVTALLADPDARLITIVGPGGIGKTRLAIAVAESLRLQEQRSFGNGIVFVDLSPLLSGAQVLPALFDTLGLESQPWPAAPDPLIPLQAFLRHRRMLLIFDNFEHVLEAAPALAEILTSAPNVKILATSRERLKLRGEHLYTLDGMRPSPSGLSSAAAELFIASARRIAPDFSPTAGDLATIQELCDLLEGMPLALELAAGWVDILPLPDIVGNVRHNLDLLAYDLQDAPDRHKTIRNTIDGSWRLLGLQQQQALARLSVFRGGFCREAAEAVAGADLRLLRQLVAKSLILRSEAAGDRYRIHEATRQFAEEKLTALGQAAETQRCHFLYYLDLTELTQPLLFGSEQLAALDQFDAERDNLRAAMTWGFDQPDQTTTSAKLVTGMSWYWRLRSHINEARYWLESALELPDLETSDLAWLLYHAGHMAWMHNQFQLAREREQQSLTLWRSLGAAGAHGAAFAQHTLGMTLVRLDEAAEALAVLQESLVLFRSVEDPWGQAFTNMWLANTNLALGRIEEADRAASASLAAFRALDNPWGQGLALDSLAEARFAAGEQEEAWKLAHEMLAFCKLVGHRHSVIMAYELQARILTALGDADGARARYNLGIVEAEEIGNLALAEELGEARQDL